jgi:drug/metabolite transporter (DMT)-like permease
MTFAYVLALLAVALTALGQLALKSAASRKPSGSRWGDRYSTIARLGAGYAALFAAVSITAYNLRVLEVNVVVSLSALCYPAVLVLSGLAFDERLTRRQWVGLCIICGGVILYNLE